MSDSRAPCIAQSSLLCAIPYRLYPVLLLSCFQGVFSLKRKFHEYRDRTHIGNCDRYINFAGAEVSKLFRGCVFDHRGHLGANAP